MLKILNVGANSFREIIKNKIIFIFGAGRTLESCIDIYFDNIQIENVVDNNEKVWGKNILDNGREVEVIGVDVFTKKIEEKGKENCILFVSAINYAVDIVEQLDVIPQLNGLECALLILVRNTLETVDDFNFTQGNMKIPKKIHYIWVGGKELPYEYEQNIETWRKYNPDYEIIRWDESNYDFKKIKYMKQAYIEKKWGFASNYARLDILYSEGGIYLDTDVEVLTNLDVLLCDDAFFNMGCTDRINIGCGVGAVKGNTVIEQMKKAFEMSVFRDESTGKGMYPCHKYIHPIVKANGFVLENRYQKHEGVVIYPMEVMSPKTIEGMPDMFTDKTLSVHKEALSWKNENEREKMARIKDFIAQRISI